MNIYMMRQHLNQIERLRVKQPSPLQSQGDIAEAIEYQLEKIEGLIAEHRGNKRTSALELLAALENADNELAKVRLEKKGVI